MAFVICKKGSGYFIGFEDMFGWLVPEFGLLEDARMWTTRKSAEDYAEQIHVKGITVKEVKGEAK